MHPAEHGRLEAAQLSVLPESAFAFPRLRKEPMTDASHVRSALARFNQVMDVSDRNVTSHLPIFKRQPDTMASRYAKPIGASWADGTAKT